MTTTNIKVAILEDHQSIVDGYLYRLNLDPKIEVVATVFFGEELEPALANTVVDVLLLDVQVPTSEVNSTPYPVLHSVTSIVRKFPKTNILAISMHTQTVLIQSLVDAGIKGYIVKDDYESIRQLAKIVSLVANGGIFFSESIYRQIRQNQAGDVRPLLSPRQVEVLSLCASYPDISTDELAIFLGVASSTLRNTLSGAYVRLEVHTRAAAIVKAQKLGLLIDSSSRLG
jgi:DNA-binding NarL/FixJ family response regulator